MRSLQDWISGPTPADGEIEAKGLTTDRVLQMAGLHFELGSPAKLLFSGDVESVVIPGTEGEMTILLQHAPILTSLRAGVVVVSSAKGADRIFVRGGFAEVNPKGLTVLAERAIPESEMSDEDRAALSGGAAH